MDSDEEDEEEDVKPAKRTTKKREMIMSAKSVNSKRKKWKYITIYSYLEIKWCFKMEAWTISPAEIDGFSAVAAGKCSKTSVPIMLRKRLLIWISQKKNDKNFIMWEKYFRIFSYLIFCYGGKQFAIAWGDRGTNKFWTIIQLQALVKYLQRRNCFFRLPLTLPFESIGFNFAEIHLVEFFFIKM